MCVIMMGRRRCVTRKGKKTTLVANDKPYAVKRAVQEKECRELQVVLEYRNDRHKQLMVMMERKQKLMGEIPEFPEVMSRNQGLGRQDLGGGGSGFAGQEAGDEVGFEGNEKYRSGGVERHSCCLA